jgi:uncharacterized coiled-coil DUF342 family protein
MTAILFVCGCASLGLSEPEKETTPAQPVATSQGQKFAESKSNGPTAVESALAWSEKYNKLSEEMTQEHAKNQLLKEENDKLKEKLSGTEKQLEQAQKELAEANSLLIDMRKELNNWKNDVLGYRDEMRNANKVQIEALGRILSMLGGEIQNPTADVNTKSESKVNEPNQ